MIHYVRPQKPVQRVEGPTGCTARQMPQCTAAEAAAAAVRAAGQVYADSAYDSRKSVSGCTGEGVSSAHPAQDQRGIGYARKGVRQLAGDTGGEQPGSTSARAGCMQAASQRRKGTPARRHG